MFRSRRQGDAASTGAAVAAVAAGVTVSGAMTLRAKQRDASLSGLRAPNTRPEKEAGGLDRNTADAKRKAMQEM